MLVCGRGQGRTFGSIIYQNNITSLPTELGRLENLVTLCVPVQGSCGIGCVTRVQQEPRQPDFRDPDRNWGTEEPGPLGGMGGLSARTCARCFMWRRNLTNNALTAIPTEVVQLGSLEELFCAGDVRFGGKNSCMVNIRWLQQPNICSHRDRACHRSEVSFCTNSRFFPSLLFTVQGERTWDTTTLQAYHRR